MDITKFIVNQREKALLVGDYGSYRRQLSRRLHTVRRKLDHTSAKGRKYVAKAPITAEDIANNHEFVHLLLLTSERAWAQAMHMKLTHAAESGAKGITGSTQRHISSRIRKASVYAEHLVDLLEAKEASGARSEDILEARAYLMSMQGATKFEKQNWEECLQDYSEARFLYASFARSGHTKVDDLFRDLLSSTIDPSIRYAAYQLRIPRTKSIDAIVARYVSRTNEYVKDILKSNPDILNDATAGTKKGSDGSAENTPKTITWKSRVVNLEDAATAQALGIVASAEETLSSFLKLHPDSDPRAKAAAYDAVLIPSQDAVDATKTAIEELSAEGVPQGDKRMQALQITRTAVNFALVGWRIGRNRILCGEQSDPLLEKSTVKKPKKPRKDGKEWVAKEESTGRKLSKLRERVVLYDATLQSVDSVKELPGVAADQAFVVELDAKRAYFAALRCLAIARSHSLLGNTKNALALFSRALQLSTQATGALSQKPSSEEKPPTLEITPTQTKDLHSLLQTLQTHHRALVDLQNLSTTTISSQTKTNPTPMIERLNEYAADVDLKNLVTYPPVVEPIPVKPLFFDVAWNYIEYPGRQRSTSGVARVNGGSGGEDRTVEEKKEAKKGWFGFGR